MLQPLITLSTDYGAGSHYLGVLKGAILSAIPSAVLVDISHNTSVFDVGEAAFVLKNVHKHFPSGTFHLLAIDANVKAHKQVLVCEVGEQYFIGTDNGIFSMMFDELPHVVYKVLDQHVQASDTFLEKSCFVNIVASHFQKGSFQNMVEPGKIKNIKQVQQPILEGERLKGVVMFIDAYFNAITNIHKTLFEEIVGNRPFRIYYAGNSYINRISAHYSDLIEGDEVAIFNENGFLELAMNRGKGSKLMGLKIGSRIMIEWNDTDTLN